MCRLKPGRLLDKAESSFFSQQDPELAEMLQGYQEALPQMMAAVGMTGVASSLIEWMQIYLYGFIMLLFPLIFIIIAVNKLVMGLPAFSVMQSIIISSH